MNGVAHCYRQVSADALMDPLDVASCRQPSHWMWSTVDDHRWRLIAPG